jgi:hypothetical protein
MLVSAFDDGARPPSSAGAALSSPPIVTDGITKTRDAFATDGRG